MKARTGIPALDELIRRGYPRPKSMLFFTVPAVDVRSAMARTIHNELASNRGIVYVAHGIAPGHVRESLSVFGVDVKRYERENAFVVLDCYSARIPVISKEKFYVSTPTSMEVIVDGVNEAIAHVKKSSKKTAVVFDSVSSIISALGEDKSIGFVERLIPLVEPKDLLFMILVNWSYSKVFCDSIKEFFDAVVDFDMTFTDGIITNYYSIDKLEREKGITRWIPYSIKPGIGIFTKIPKILVMGAHGSGKTTAVSQLSTVEPVKIGTEKGTVVMDIGRVVTEDLEARLIGVPGRERFSFLVPILKRGASAAMLIVDSTNREQIERTSETMTEFDVPFVVLANKRDMPGALGLKEIRRIMKLDASVPMIPTIAIDGKGLKKAFNTLIERMLGLPKGKRKS